MVIRREKKVIFKRNGHRKGTKVSFGRKKKLAKCTKFQLVSLYKENEQLEFASSMFLFFHKLALQSYPSYIRNMIFCRVTNEALNFTKQQKQTFQ